MTYRGLYGDIKLGQHWFRLWLPLSSWRNNNVVITSKQHHFDAITSQWRRFGVITTSWLLRNVSAGLLHIWHQLSGSHYLNQWCLLISEVQWAANTASAQIIILSNEFESYTFDITSTSLRRQTNTSTTEMLYSSVPEPILTYCQ